MIHLPSASQSQPVLRFWSLAGMLTLGSLLILLGTRRPQSLL